MTELIYRAYPMRAGRPSKKDSSVPFVIATENPADMGWGMPEILLAEGLRIEDPARGVPLLNAHNRSDVSHVLGRVTDIRVEGKQIKAKYKFSKATQAARDAFGLVEDGSIDAASVGYRIDEFRELAEGETFGDGDDQVIGPAIVVTAWTLKESSLVPIGADKDALTRALSTAKEAEMARRTRKKKTATKADAEKADEEDEDEKKKADDEEEEKAKAEDEEEEKAKADDEEDEEKGDDEDEDEMKEEAKAAPTLDALAAQALEDRKRLVYAFTPADLRSFAEGLFLTDPNMTPEAARAALLEERARRLTPTGTPEPGTTQTKPTTPSKRAEQQPEVNGEAALTRLIRER